MGAALGSLVILPMIPFAASANPVAQTNYQQITIPDRITIPATGEIIYMSDLNVVGTPPWPQNPCPNLYYEYPHNSRIVVPEVCQNNAVTQELQNLGLLQAVRNMANNNNAYYPNRTY
ncbi:hypothetical protein [Gloeothece verrucosa]|nr:hypothetical protein [Gloeothece verrucosa]